MCTYSVTDVQFSLPEISGATEHVFECTGNDTQMYILIDQQNIASTNLLEVLFAMMLDAAMFVLHVFVCFIPLMIFSPVGSINPSAQ